MASDPNAPPIPDVLASAVGQSPMPPMLPAATPQSPTLLSPTPAPAATPTEDNAPGPSSITLPPRTAENTAFQPTETGQPPSMLSKIGRFAATLAGGPQLADPNATPEQKAQGVLGILGRIGNVGAAAFGSPQQRQLAVERGQQQIEQQKIPLQMAQLQNELQYRNALVGNNANKTAEQVRKDQATEALKLQETTRKYEQQGMVPQPGSDPSNPHFIDMSPEQVASSQLLSANVGLKQSAAAAAKANADYKQAQTDALKNPDSLTQKNKAEALRIQATNAGMQFANKMFEMRKQNQESLFNYGQAVPGGVPEAPAAQPSPYGGRPFAPSPDNPQGLNLSNAAEEMMVDPVTGNPIPLKMLASMKPTMQEQNRADFAKSAMHSADNIQHLIDTAQAQIGPFSGRIEALMAKAGLGDQFNQELQNYVRFTQSAATAAHTGRFSVPILEKMDKMIGPEMNADQVKGAIESIKGQMQPYADAGWKPSVAEYRAWLSGEGTKPGGGKATPSSPGAPKQPKATPSAQINAITLPASMGGGHPADYAEGPSGAIVKIKAGGPWVYLATGKPVTP